MTELRELSKRPGGAPAVDRLSPSVERREPLSPPAGDERVIPPSDAIILVPEELLAERTMQQLNLAEDGDEQTLAAVPARSLEETP